MKTIWNIISVLALANVLAVAGVVGWLSGSGRLDAQRLRDLRELFAEPADQERAREAEEAASAEAARAEEEAAAHEAEAPLSAAEQLHVRLDLSEVDHQQIERLRLETRDLKDTIEAGQARLAQQREAFEAERTAFERMRSELEAVEGSAQFRKAVGTLAGLRADDAVSILLEILRRPTGNGAIPIDPGESDAPDGSIPIMLGGADQVVAYLDAMPERSRNRIMSSLAGSDPVLAADLLERLRTRGLLARAPESSSP
ncbi:MAG: hypothetical protein H6809_01780 [Phycisphaeraceae bacterium]|nr:hypothetical protein [Phycisphaeraceae bacterium]